MEKKHSDGQLLGRRSFLKSGLPFLAGGAALAACSPDGAPQTQATAVGGAAQISGESKLNEVLQRGHLIVGTTLTIPPWGFEDENGNPAGFDIEIAKIFAKGLFDDPEAVEFFEQEMDARLPNLATGKVDLTIQLMTVTAQRAQTAEFTIPYYREAVTTLLPADSPYSGAKDMEGQGVSVSILQNVFAEDLVHMAIEDAQVEQFDTVANAILALDGGRVDAYVGGFGEAKYFTAQSPDKYKVGDFGWIPQSYACGVRTGDQVWLNWLNTTLHEAVVGVEFSTYKDAFNKYFGTELQDPPFGFPVEYGDRGGAQAA